MAGTKLPNGLTQKQEQFCQAFVRLGNAHHAYKEAYNAEGMKANTIDRKAYDLVHNGKVAARIKQIQESIQKKTEVTAETITKMLAQAYKQANSLSQPSAAVAAAMGMAKLHGLIVNKSEDVTPRRHSGEIDARLRQLLGQRDQVGASKPARRKGTGDGAGEAVPTVSGHGTA